MKHLYLVSVLILVLPLTAIQALVKGSNAWVEVLQNKVSTTCTIAGYLNTSYGLTTGWRGDTYYTSDGGKTWSVAKYSSWCLERVGLEILNNQFAWNCGKSTEIMMTTNGGKDWYKIANYGASGLLGPTGVNHYLNFCDTHNGWMASEFKLSQTIDGGKNWTDLKLPAKLSGAIGAIALRSPHEGFLLDRDKGGTLYVTRDNGRTWHSQPIGFKVQLFPVTYTPSAVMRFTSTKRGIIIANCKTTQGNQIWSFTTLDRGKSWRQELIWNGIGNLFLNRDGKFLTIYDGYGKITVLENRSVL